MKKFIIFSLLIVIICMGAWYHLRTDRPLSRPEAWAKGALKNAMTAQEAFKTDHQTYTTKLFDLTDIGLHLRDGIFLIVLDADQDSFEIFAYHENGERAFYNDGINQEIRLIPKKESQEWKLKIRASQSQRVPELLSDLQSPDLKTRVDAIKAISAIEDERTVEPLIERLKDTNSEVRAEAALALGRYPNALAVLSTTLLGDSEVEVRRNAAIALKKIPDKRIIPPLLKTPKGSGHGK